MPLTTMSVTTLPGVAALRSGAVSGWGVRAGFVGVVMVAALAGFVAPHDGAGWGVADAGLVRLLRAMAGLKAVFAAGAVAGVVWRLRAPVGWVRLAGYVVACGAMAAGPGLIWHMAHLRLGAALLHGGLLASVVLLWRDPACAALLSRAIAARRSAHS